MVSNEGPFQSLSQIGLSTAEVGTGPNAVSVNQGRLLAPTSDREVIADLIKTKTDLQNAIRTQSEDLYTLFANVMESQLDHKGSRDMSSGFSVSDQLEFTIGDGSNTATITFTAGSYSQNQLLNKVNQALLQAGMSGSVLAYYDANNQLTVRSTKEEEQAFLEIQDRSLGSDSLQGLIGLQPGLFFGPDPEISGGVAMRSRSYINSITGIGGIVTERIKEQGTFARRIQNYNEAIQRQEEHLANYEYDLRQKFARMETQLGELNNQMQAVEAAISKMNASTGGSSSGGSQ
jgi:flagellar capping protein FliD